MTGVAESRATAQRAVSEVAARKRRLTAKERREELEGYAYLSPWLLGFFAFTAIPIVASIALSLTRYSVFRPPTWAGLDNYRMSLGGGDALVWPSIGRSFYYAVVSVPLRLTGSLLVAMLLNQELKLTAFWRTLFFLPSLTPSVATAYVWRWLLNADIGVLRIDLRKLFQGKGSLEPTETPCRSQLRRNGVSCVKPNACMPSVSPWSANWSRSRQRSSASTTSDMALLITRRRCEPFSRSPGGQRSEQMNKVGWDSPSRTKAKIN